MVELAFICYLCRCQEVIQKKGAKAEKARKLQYNSYKLQQQSVVPNGSCRRESDFSKLTKKLFITRRQRMALIFDTFQKPYGKPQRLL